MKRARGRGLALALTVAGAVLPSCVGAPVYVGEEGPECQIDLDCANRGLPDEVCVDGACEPRPVETTWGCLDGPPLAPSNGIIDLRLEVISALTRTPAVGALVRACNRIDPACNSPLVPDTPVGVNGQVTMSVPESFNGYFEVRSNPAEPDKYVPQLAFVPTREVMRREGPGLRVLLFAEAEIKNLLQLVGGTFALDEPPNALTLATALDCLGAPAAGVSLELTSPEVASTQTVQFYTDDYNLPRTVATETSESGTFGLTNLVASTAAGTVALRATVNSLQRTMGNDMVFYVRDNWVTVVYIAP